MQEPCLSGQRVGQKGGRIVEDAFIHSDRGSVCRLVKGGDPSCSSVVEGQHLPLHFGAAATDFGVRALGLYHGDLTGCLITKTSLNC